MTPSSSFDISLKNTQSRSYDAFQPRCGRPFRAVTLPQSDHTREAPPRDSGHSWKMSNSPQSEHFGKHWHGEKIPDRSLSCHSGSIISSSSLSKHHEDPPHLSEFYQCTWYRFLIAMDVFLLQEVVVIMIISASRVNFLIIPSILWSIFCISIATFIWAATFTFGVVFIRKRRIEKPSHLRKIERLTLRLCASTWFMVLNCAASYFMVSSLLFRRWIPGT